MEHYIPSKALRATLYVLIGAFLILSVFGFGMQFGARHARFVIRHDIPHHDEFGFFGFDIFPHMMPPKDVHGVVGTISSIALPRISITSQDGATSTALVASTTLIRDADGDEPVSTSTLTPGNTIVVIGEPDSSSTEDTIEARFIRVLTSYPSQH
ncbi:MAG TPA: hypothetical protein VF803_00255 [Candidatus Paceibacterota bacterium]